MFGYELLVLLASVVIARLMDAQMEKKNTKFREGVLKELAKQREEFDTYYRELHSELRKEREEFSKEMFRQREEFRVFLEGLQESWDEHDR
ncbi:MAG: hypothetical protein E6789_00725 [Clostridium baratii]|nr:hypothetical protein [Clostridium baratii]